MTELSMAIELPKSTEFNKKIPKQKFYENLEISPALKKIFIGQVDKIIWSNKIASSTTNLYKVCISYKEATISGNIAFKVNSYYYTDWLDKQNLPLKLEGLNLDAAYENFVRQIAGETLQKIASDESLKESVARLEQKELLQRQIFALESKIHKEKQPLL